MTEQAEQQLSQPDLLVELQIIERRKSQVAIELGKLLAEQEALRNMEYYLKVQIIRDKIT